MDGTPQFFANLSTLEDSASAALQLCAQIEDAAIGDIDLLCLFFSSHHTDHMADVVRTIKGRLHPRYLLGCSADSVIGHEAEVENGPGIVAWCGRMPGAQIEMAHLDIEKTPDGIAIVGWPDALVGPWPEHSLLLVLGEPFSFPMDLLLERLNEDQAGVPVVGGMASQGHAPGQNRLLMQDNMLTEGAVVARIRWKGQFATVVSQGCRPIGEPLVVTKSERNEIQQLGGKPALSQLKAIFEVLPNREKRIIQQGLQLGRVVSEYQDHFEQGDFLIRNVLGFDQESEAIVVADYIRPGQTVQFQIRDGTTAHEEMSERLRHLINAGTFQPQGCLLFSCNGRGLNLFGFPNHDISTIKECCGDLPVAGFFAAGEIGPVGGSNFVHGFTASMVLFGIESRPVNR